jgi:hypothetical protein
MARTRTAEELVADVRNRAGMEFSELLDDSEILEILNQELAELRGHLRMNEGQVHKQEKTDIAVVAGTTLYDLPDDFWELLGCVATIGGRVRPMEPFMENERPNLENGTYFATIAAPMYRIADDFIEILPATQDFTLTLRYAPTQGRLRLGRTPADTVDGYNGYEVAAIYGAVACCQAKDQADPSFYEGRKARILMHIDALAAQRDAARPERVTDVTGGLSDEFGPWFG